MTRGSTEGTGGGFAMNLLGRRFQPRFGPTLATACMFAVLLGLGTWQLQRLDWKENLIAERQGRAQEPAVALPAEIVDPAGLEFRRVRLSGRFSHGKELYLGARSHQGSVGVHVVTPLVTADGRTVLVDRGWVPEALKAPESRAAAQIEGAVVQEGLLRLGGWKGYDFVRPENLPAENFWFWIDLPAMAGHLGLENPVTALYVEAGPAENPGGYPLGGQTRMEIRNDHLQYAMIWYALAVALLVIYVLHQSRRAGPEENHGRL